jgi:cytochrome b involved in lipid metabolism
VRRRPLAPAGQALPAVEEQNRRLGHENLGFLSISRGFLPVGQPRLALSARYRAWDEVAARLPELHRSLELRQVIDQMPLLRADPGSLPDEDLQRAATLLGVLAHAYRYVSATKPAGPPPSITQPWRDVCARLARAQPVLSYVDLIAYNWRLAEPEAPDPMSVGNLRLLVPTVDNQEERVFYLTQTEILARCTPVVSAVARAQDAVVADAPDELRRELLVVIDALQAVVRRSLPTISPRPTSATYVDPVVWARTVAPFAVPLQPDQLGPSGTASPVFSLLDSFFGRARHDSRLGREVRGHRAGYPPNWRRFLAAVDQVSAPAYVERLADPGLTDLFRKALDLYAGPAGFLGRHRRKVAGYLEIAFKVGRNVTIGGFSGGLQDRAWERVDHELERSRAERVPSPSATPRRGNSPDDQADVSHRLSDLVLHNDEDHGYWVSVDGGVYDVTSLLLRHPGGPTVLEAYAGRDATATYRRLHASSAAADRLRRDFRIGSLRPIMATFDGRGGWAAKQVAETWARQLDLVVEMKNVLRHDYSLRRAVGPGREPEAPRSPYLLDRAVETHERFLHHYLRPLTEDGADVLWQVTARWCTPHPPAAWMRTSMEDIWASPQGSQALALPDRLRARITATTDRATGWAADELLDVEAHCAYLEEQSLAFLHDLKLVLREGVIHLETSARMPSRHEANCSSQQLNGCPLSCRPF